MEKVIQEKISADHLLHVSMKYTKTTDVMLNLIARWKSMIETAIDRLLYQAKKIKKIKSIPTIPKIKIEVMRVAYKKNPEVLSAVDLYEFFKRVENMRKERECEFRKNVTLRVFDKGKEVNINMDKLKEWNETLERFINNIKQIF